MKLLVVEDELYAREALVRQIEKYDITHTFEIFQAANGADGWEICQKSDPELVLTDIRMPKMDGLQLLEQIRKDGRKTKVIILSAYSDFEYARSALANGAFDYLLKPIDDEMLAKCLNRLMEQHRTERKEALLSGRDMATQYLLKSIRTPGYSGFVEKTVFARTFPSYQLGVIFFVADSQNAERNISEAAREKFPGALEREYGAAFLTKLRFLELESGLWVLVIRPEGDTLFLWRRIRKILEEAGLNVRIGVSAVQSTGASPGTACKEVMDLLKCRLNQKESILFAERQEKEVQMEYYLPKAQEDLLEKALEYGNSQKTQEVLDEIFESVNNSLPIRCDCLELLYSQIMVLYRRAISLEETSAELEKGTERLMQFDTLNDLRDYLKRIASGICRMRGVSSDAESKPAQSGNEIVAKMTAYAMEHYSTDVTVRELAESVFFMNQNYISHLFAEKKGISFSAFLWQVRISHAKELLKEEKWSVTEVAAMVGYNDTSQFIRIFRQEVGVTPKKYRAAGATEGNLPDS